MPTRRRRPRSRCRSARTSAPIRRCGSCASLAGARAAPNEQMLQAQRDLAAMEGIYAETSSALSVAVLPQAARQRRHPAGRDRGRGPDQQRPEGSETTAAHMPGIPDCTNSLESALTVLSTAYGLDLAGQPNLNHDRKGLLMLMNTARARTLMEADGIDGVISATLESNFYLSGIWAARAGSLPARRRGVHGGGRGQPRGRRGRVLDRGGDLALCGYDSLSAVHTFGTFFRDYVEGISLTPGEQRVLDITNAHSTDSGVPGRPRGRAEGTGPGLGAGRGGGDRSQPEPDRAARRAPAGGDLRARPDPAAADQDGQDRGGTRAADRRAACHRGGHARGDRGGRRRGDRARTAADLRAHHPRPRRPSELHPAALRPRPGARPDPGRGRAAEPRRHHLLRRGLQLRRLQVRHRQAGVVRRARRAAADAVRCDAGPASRPRST